MDYLFDLFHLVDVHRPEKYYQAIIQISPSFSLDELSHHEQNRVAYFKCMIVDKCDIAIPPDRDNTKQPFQNVLPCLSVQ